MHRIAGRITSCVLKLLNEYLRAPVHAFDGDGCAIVVGGKRQLGAIGRTHARDGGEKERQQQAEGTPGANGGSHFDRGVTNCLEFPPGHNRNVRTGGRRGGGGEIWGSGQIIPGPLIAEEEDLLYPASLPALACAEVASMVGARCRPKLGSHSPCCPAQLQGLQR